MTIKVKNQKQKKNGIGLWNTVEKRKKNLDSIFRFIFPFFFSLLCLLPPPPLPSPFLPAVLILACVHYNPNGGKRGFSTLRNGSRSVFAYFIPVNWLLFITLSFQLLAFSIYESHVYIRFFLFPFSQQKFNLRGKVKREREIEGKKRRG